MNLNNIEWVIAVPHNIIGPRQKYDDPFRNVVSIMINRMMQGKAPIIYGDGEQTRCFSYIDDCLSCLIPMLDQKNLNKQTINIGPDEEFVTINKIAEICSNLTGVNLNQFIKKIDLKKSNMQHVLLIKQDHCLTIKQQCLFKKV